MQVNLFKRKVSYVNADGEERTGTNFFIACGDILVPIEAKYFENKETGRDDRYLGRKTLLSAFATTLSENNSDSKNTKSEKQPSTFHHEDNVDSENESSSL